MRPSTKIERLLDLAEFLLDTSQRYGTGNPLAVGKEHGRSASNVELAAEFLIFGNRSGIAIFATGWALAIDHPVIPCLGAVGSTPDLLRFLDRVLGQDRIQKGVHRHVVELEQVLGQIGR